MSTSGSKLSCRRHYEAYRFVWLQYTTGYEMLVEDEVERQLHVEKPGEYRVSSEEHLLAGT